MSRKTWPNFLITLSLVFQYSKFNTSNVSKWQNNCLMTNENLIPYEFPVNSIKGEVKLVQILN